ncbi:hypothetical protein G5C51_11305 [Streptomyces sp. A7024]|uniref:Uncharacterized protein n=1 Tax=Streptomyces coryli TaxID=1128680 RepID=A0A6G4TZD7_9ACTN|nr:hypothetical protein [Streptomyces coryli]NGN64488.1 hypothetical protein [Streptomyces coryli]
MSTSDESLLGSADDIARLRELINRTETGPQAPPLLSLTEAHAAAELLLRLGRYVGGDLGGLAVELGGNLVRRFPSSEG